VVVGWVITQCAGLADSGKNARRGQAAQHLEDGGRCHAHASWIRVLSPILSPARLAGTFSYRISNERFQPRTGTALALGIIGGQSPAGVSTFSTWCSVIAKRLFSSQFRRILFFTVLIQHHDNKTVINFQF